LKHGSTKQNCKDESFFKNCISSGAEIVQSGFKGVMIANLNSIHL
jgi:hypothetical protein